MPRLIHKNSGKVLAEDLIFSHNIFQRMKGLLGYKELKAHQAMWIKPSSSIHTCFMQFPIDVIFINQNWRIQCFYENIPPWKIVSVFGKTLSPWRGLFHPMVYYSSIKNIFNTISVFEFKAGRLLQFTLKKGDSVYVDA